MSLKAIHAKLLDCDRRNYVMVLDSMGTDIHSEEEGPDSAVFGMVGGHAYSLIRTVHHKGFRLCRIRNPWGTFEWGGDWSDKSPLWQEHPDVKSVCNPRLDKEDGIFWMAFADVCAHFRAVTVCRLAQNAPKYPSSQVRLQHSSQSPSSGPKGTGSSGKDGSPLFRAPPEMQSTVKTLEAEFSQAMADDRFFPNTYSEEEHMQWRGGDPHGELLEAVQRLVANKFESIAEADLERMQVTCSGLYKGPAGIAYMYFRLALFQTQSSREGAVSRPPSSLLHRAYEWATLGEENVPATRVSFLEGLPG
ncbi:hypothetical protein CYMTET_22543 [Cymbomonas tetramitiformis]|uniref:Calpain catalytic domain-containing protein n=1 Tax=Cymbomonas tetramitiformis TaxID=36881 RepID=A0AAE0L234_9CHLO|nr:hypothetical protein CYMTET_22543 [Cymbomonas tetramitiformis]